MSLSSENGGVPAVMNVTPTGGTGYNNGGGWGGDWSAWIVIFILFACFGGFGGGWGGFGGGWGGFGGGFGGGAYPTESILQRSLDTQTIIGKLDGVNHGLCDGFYAMNTGMLTGFNNIGNAICNAEYQNAQLVNGVNSNMMQGFNATQMAMMQGFNAAQAQAAECCCKTQTNIMQLGNQVERGFCQSNYNDQANTTAIIQNAHNDTDRVLAKLDAMEMSRKDETIAALRSQVDALNLAQSQANQNNYLVNQLRPCPTPAYLTCNPWAAQAPYGSCGNCGGCNC